VSKKHRLCVHNSAYLFNFCCISHSSHASIFSILASTVVALREPAMSLSNKLAPLLLLLDAANAGADDDERAGGRSAAMRAARRLSARDRAADVSADNAAAGATAGSTFTMVGVIVTEPCVCVITGLKSLNGAAAAAA
jgi:hypothetical protein